MFSIIAAVGKRSVIGRKNDLPWHIKEDLRKFKELTFGKTVVMGRKTYDSITGRLNGPLPNRRNVVISKEDWPDKPSDVVVYHDLDSALNDLRKEDEVMIIGGASIYRQTIDRVDRLYITEVDQDVPDGDTFFPEIDPSKWKKTAEEKHDGFSFVQYEREIL
ncbi:MAG: dihydrofolate reductase [Candidatus Saccharibacteria bacterium]